LVLPILEGEAALQSTGTKLNKDFCFNKVFNSELALFNIEARFEEKIRDIAKLRSSLVESEVAPFC
jgi:hypothetical protein